MNIYNTDCLVSITEVCRLLNRSKASIYRDIKRGAFPRQIKIGYSAKWRMSDIESIIRKSPEEQK
ncbi:AlpA family phage regulatory protein [Cohaesibacter sp. CAU 1516]|uniref:helix-turn-helix transcriptional regulator n=1 Tax=Cohaesibacter sp. CAU 1516 TaxID=2576038 RepID=UPI0010FD214F|nr:helix-turn-helix domain-containing protein [Cohaesibacter sp. CAU 1516]TLP43956.1 AlpA family phage regulatory protein [Cohaesibacter sp. CAU 1516]